MTPSEGLYRLVRALRPHDVALHDAIELMFDAPTDDDGPRIADYVARHTEAGLCALLTMRELIHTPTLVVAEELRTQVPQAQVMAARQLLEAMPDTCRELFPFVTDGLTTREMARRLVLSETAVKSRLAKMYRLAGVTTRVHMARLIYLAGDA